MAPPNSTATNTIPTGTTDPAVNISDRLVRARQAILETDPDTIRERARKETFARQPEWEKLEAILLEHGGERINYTYEEDLTELTDPTESYLQPSEEVWVLNGPPSQCHANSAALHEREGHHIVTGWALYEGAWYQHSWCAHAEDADIILETTPLRRDAYYGYFVEGDKLTSFLFHNR